MSSYPEPHLPGGTPPIVVPPIRRVPAGEYWMGADPDDKFTNDTERPSHRVSIEPDFWLGVYPVTVGEYRAFHPSHEPHINERWPVAGVNWCEANAYCGWLREMTGDAWRLPTEAEWEYAARAGAQTAYPWGDDISVQEANYYYAEDGGKVGLGRRTEVGSYAANAFGLHDMHGNVGEWTADLWHSTYEGAPSHGTAWVDESGDSRRVLRGGAWDYLPRLLRSCWRDALPETVRRDNVGFRVACDL